MLRLSSICPFCEASALLRYTQPSWTGQRYASTLQKRKPSRMTLSANVRRGPPTTRPSPSATANAQPSGKPRHVRRSRNSPFGGMNITSAPRTAEIQRNKISVAEQRRQARNVKTGTQKTDDKSRDPMKALKMQRRLSNVSYETRGKIKETIAERDEFDSFGLLPAVHESIKSQALGGRIDAVPSPIQRVAIPALMGLEEKKKGRRKRTSEPQAGMQQFLLAAETGSGKTLAYVLPIIDAIKRAEIAEKQAEAYQAEREEEQRRKERRNRLFQVDEPDADEPDPSSARPRAIILVPTSELVDQVGAVIKSLSHIVKFRSALLSANYTGKVIRSRLFSAGGIDIVVSTPHLLSSITESDPNILSRVSHLVIDEADSLLDRSFSPTTSSIIDRASPSLKQLVFCSATIPRSLDSYISKRFPETRRLVTPNLHAIPRRVQLSVIDIEKVPYQGNRNLACAQVIWEIGKEGSEEGEAREKKILVFVNEREKTEELATYLRSKGIEALALSRDSADRKSAEALAAFTGQPAPPGPKQTHLPQPTAVSASELPFSQPTAVSPSDLPFTHKPLKNAPSKLPNTKVVISTDLTSRGIDTLALKHVILYDVPHTSIDFIHRLGRVGRMGRRGRGVVLVGKGDRRDVVKEVKDGMFRGQALI